jgi:drug/metabolite transporter (DMT)-like permease
MAASILSRAQVPAIYGSLGRFAFGSLGLLAIMAFRGSWPRPTSSQWLRILAMGFFGVFLYNICFFNGLRTIPSGRASLMASLQPSVVLLFSAALWGERITALKISGLALSLLGASLVLTQANPAKLFQQGLGTGDLWILGTVVSWVSYTLIGRGLLGRLDTLPATAYGIFAGFAMLLLYAAFLQTPPPDFSSPAFWLISAFLGILGTTLAFTFYLRGIETLGASRASIFINLVPIFSVLSSNIALGEPLTWPTLLGGALALSGVTLLNRK